MVVGAVVFMLNVMMAHFNFSTGHPYLGIFNACAAAVILSEMMRTR